MWRTGKGDQWDLSKLSGWHHLAVSAIGGQATFYVDAAPIGTLEFAMTEDLQMIGNVFMIDGPPGQYKHGIWDPNAINAAWGAEIKDLSVFMAGLTAGQIGTVMGPQIDGKLSAGSGPLSHLTLSESSCAFAGLISVFFEFEQSCQDGIQELDGRYPALTKVDSMIAWHETYELWPGLKFGQHFASRHSGYLTINTAAEYIFFLSAADMARLKIDGNDVVAIRGCHDSMQVETATIELKAGTHKLEVDYNEVEGASGLVLEWESEGSFTREAIPAQYLSHSRNTIKPGLIAQYYEYEQGCNLPETDGRSPSLIKVEKMVRSV